VRFSLLILAVVLTFTWVLAPAAPPWGTAAAVIAVLALSIARALRTGEWGVTRAAFAPALLRAAAITAVAAIGFYVAGVQLGTWHERENVWPTLAALVPWALGQQFALHTVFLREAQAAVSRPAGIWIAAAMFAALHLPNPFLTLMTGAGALVWCWIYDRYPNLLPMALSHALLTLVILYAFDDSLTHRLRVGAGY
jgi:membrane protease YdiL (CAAX protease family)